MKNRTTAILNLKGGVAKTVTTINMAAIIATDYKKRVLIIDADSQCNTTEFFGVDPKVGNLAYLLRGPGNHPNPGAYAASHIQQTYFPGIDILAGDESLIFDRIANRYARSKESVPRFSWASLNTSRA